MSGLSDIKTADQLFDYIRSDASFTDEIAARLLGQLSEEEKTKFDELIAKAKEANAKKHGQQASQPDTLEKVTKATIVLASEIWDRVQQEYRKGTMQKLSDEEKMAKIRDARPEYKSFLDTHPVASKYMICAQKFALPPFKRYVERRLTFQYLPKDRQTKEYVKEQYAMRQAEYVAYLYEYMERKARPTPKQIATIKENTYRLLLGEIDDFAEMRDKADAKVGEILSERRQTNADFIVQKVTQSGDAASTEALREILIKKILEKRARAEEEKQREAARKLAEKAKQEEADAEGRAAEAETEEKADAEAVDPQTESDIADIIGSECQVVSRADDTPV